MTHQELDELEKLSKEADHFPYKNVGVNSEYLTALHPSTALRLISLARWALEARDALEWENNRCGKVFGPLGDALSKFPKEDECKQQNVIV